VCEVAILVGIDKLHEAFTLYHLAYRQRSGYLTFLRTDPTKGLPDTIQVGITLCRPAPELAPGFLRVEKHRDSCLTA